jgi:hypothetical protein
VRYRDETAGLALIDSSHEDEIESYRRYYGNDPEGDWVDGGDPIDIDATARALRRTARDYGDLPLVVLQAGEYGTSSASHCGSARRPTWRPCRPTPFTSKPPGGHFVMNDDPRVIVAVVNAVVDAARSGAGLPPCPQIVTGTDATCP